jgi:hypothetical protein
MLCLARQSDSVGQHINSTDPKADPVINPCYFEEEYGQQPDLRYRILT